MYVEYSTTRNDQKYCFKGKELPYNYKYRCSTNFELDLFIIHMLEKSVRTTFQHVICIYFVKPNCVKQKASPRYGSVEFSEEQNFNKFLSAKT